MIRLAALLAVLPLCASAQGVADDPRALAIFAPAAGYTDLPPERVGQPARPEPTELGLVLVARMFRNVCLGLENGAALDDVLPPGFAAYESTPYLMGTAPTGNTDRLTLSPTGDIDRDETQGHPTFRLSAAPGGMTCLLDWRLAAPPDTGPAANMALYLAQWFPFEFALVAASRPAMTAQPQTQHLADWDRPCAGRWCRMTALYDLDRGHITLETTLNITSIGGPRP